MNIRTRLTLTFFMVVIIVLTTITVSIYFLSSSYRKEDFYRRLQTRAMNMARVLNEGQVRKQVLKHIEANNPASLPNQHIRIFDVNHEELYRSESVLPNDVDAALQKQLREDSEIRFRAGKYEALGFVFSYKNTQQHVWIAATDIYGLNALANLRNVLLVIFCISIVLVSALGWMYAGKVLQPISNIVTDVSKITEANLSQRLPVGRSNDELAQLARTFNTMLQRLESAFTAQKSFIANASHEIKTPITVMATEIEVALLQERQREHYKKVLLSVLSGLKSLNNLSTQLLLLAQTNADDQQRDFSAIRIDDILWEVKEELEKGHPDYEIDITFDMNLNHQSLIINGDEQLVKAAVMNLMDNGCKYAPDHRVQVTLQSRHSHLTIDFVNHGDGIERENIDKIFAPFFRAKKNSKTKGFGIGLSLVKRVLDLHEGQINVESVPQAHTCFTVSFPTRV